VNDPVEGNQVDRLDNSHVVQWNVETLLGQLPKFPTGEARATERLEAVAVGPFDGAEDIGAVAGAANGNQQVGWGGEVFELFDKDPVEALIVGPGQDVRRVVGQAQHP